MATRKLNLYKINIRHQMTGEGIEKFESLHYKTYEGRLAIAINHLMATYEDINEFVEETGIPLDWYDGLLNGTTEINKKQLTRFMEKFNFSPTWLYIGEKPIDMMYEKQRKRLLI